MAFIEEPLAFNGEHTAFVNDENMTAEVRRGTRVIRTFNGESAWSDAIREAEDLNASA